MSFLSSALRFLRGSKSHSVVRYCIGECQGCIAYYYTVNERNATVWRLSADCYGFLGEMSTFRLFIRFGIDKVRFTGEALQFQHCTDDRFQIPSMFATGRIKQLCIFLLLADHLKRTNELKILPKKCQYQLSNSWRWAVDNSSGDHQEHTHTN